MLCKKTRSDLSPIARSILHENIESLDWINLRLEQMCAERRICWAFENLPERQILTSSIGIQSAVLLHMVTRLKPGIPVVLIDTGYLFSETYRFIDELTERLDLNLHCYRPGLSAAWYEARHGTQWERGKSEINRYNRFHKVEPMQRALKELESGTWIAGLRREQASTRSQLTVLRLQQGRCKLHPLIDWHKRDMHQYLQKHRLPYHPLWEKGYASVGDSHSSRPLSLEVNEEQSRFGGLVRECGLHLD